MIRKSMLGHLLLCSLCVDDSGRKNVLDLVELWLMRWRLRQRKKAEQTCSEAIWKLEQMWSIRNSGVCTWIEERCIQNRRKTSESRAMLETSCLWHKQYLMRSDSTGMKSVKHRQHSLSTVSRQTPKVSSSIEKAPRSTDSIFNVAHPLSPSLLGGRMWDHYGQMTA